MAFPTNPSPGDSYTDEYGTVWVYAGAVNGWYRQTVTTPNDTSYTAAISGPAGSNTQVQFNDNGELAGDSGLTYNKTTDALSGGAFIPTGSTVPSNGLYTPDTNQLALSTNGTGRLFVDASGNVGVGIASPAAGRKLHVSGVGTLAQFDSSNASCLFKFTNSSASLGFMGYEGDNLTFYTTNTERLRIDSSGRVGIGTSSPGANLELGPVSATEGPTLRLSAGAGGGQGIPEYPFGTIEFFSNDLNGDGEEVKASIAAVADTNSTAPGGQITFSTKPISGSTVLTERLRIDSSGRVGIGTTDPADPLVVSQDVGTGTGNLLRLNNSNFTFGTGLGSGINFMVANETTVGNISFAMATNIFAGGSIAKIATRTGDFSYFQLDVNGSERLRVDSSGRLLVGTSSAFDNFSNLQVADVTGLGISLGHFTNTPSGGSLAFYKSRSSTVGTNALVSANDRLGRLSFYGADGTNYVRGASIEAFVDGTPGANDMPTRLEFSTTADGASSPTERMRIDSDGVVKVAPVNTLGDNAYIHVYDGRSSQNVGYVASDYSGNEWHFGRSNVDGYFYVVRQTGVGMYMNTNSWVATSDQRAKQNIADIESTIDVVKALKPSRFNWKADGTADVGFIAQQVQPLIPEAVVDSGDPDAMLGITQDKLLPFVVKALQEAVAKIETLEAKVAALESA